jgi:hypothetical protein
MDKANVHYDHSSSTDLPSFQNLNCVEIIENLATKLKTHKGLYNVFAITTAKVPIVKFKHRKSQIEGDISLYNTLVSYLMFIVKGRPLHSSFWYSA